MLSHPILPTRTPSVHPKAAPLRPPTEEAALAALGEVCIEVLDNITRGQPPFPVGASTGPATRLCHPGTCTGACKAAYFAVSPRSRPPLPGWVPGKPWEPSAAQKAPKPTAPPPLAPSWVYFVQAGEGGPIKIGFSSDVGSRIAALQSGHGEPLRLLAMVPGSRPEEKALHGRFAPARVRGEWFRPTAELLDHIASLDDGPPTERDPAPWKGGVQ